jgi:hypothetical protein
MKIAMYHAAVGTMAAFYEQEFGASMVEHCNYTRVTEFAEVDFPPLPVGVVVEGKLAKLEEAEKELRNQFQKKLNDLTEARAKLLSLSHEPQS